MFYANPFFLPSNSNFCSSENSMLLPPHAAFRLSKRLIALSINSSTGLTLAPKRKLCISDFWGLAVLSLWDSLPSSTHKGSTRVIHASGRNSASMEFQGQEVLSLQNALSCSTHPSIRWRHCKILRPTRDFLQTHLQEPDFFLVHKWRVSKRHVSSFQDSYVKLLQGDLQAKVVPERTTYRVTWGVP